MAGPAVLSLNAQGGITGWSATAEVVTGFTAAEAIGREFGLLYPEEALDVDEPARTLQLAARHGFYREGGWKRRKGGSRFWCQTSIIALLGEDRVVEGFIVLLTEEAQERRPAPSSTRRSEEILRQSQRLEAIGRLAGGIAHDFNNLLTAIQGHAEFLLDDLPEDHPAYVDAVEIRRSADRATALTRQLLTFSRRQELQPTTLNVNEVIEDTRLLLRRVIGEDIELHIQLQPELWSATADRGQLEQVITNLVLNARDAMPRGGSIVIRTGNVELDHEYASLRPGVTPGNYIMLSITDTGVGMDRETQEHIFEPFFTTKEPGRGTGLGLATVYGIVKQSGGHIWVYSEPGKGTTFKVYLPRAAAAGTVVQGTEVLADRAATGETLLLLEDDDEVRALATRVLQQRGYTVLGAASTSEARQIAKEYRGPIDLLVADVVIDHGDGHGAAKELQPLRPEMRLLFMSGYSHEDAQQRSGIEVDAPFLEKPFTPDRLARKVREVLDGTR